MSNFTWYNGKVYDMDNELVSNPKIWYPSLESWFETTQKKRKIVRYMPVTDFIGVHEDDGRYFVDESSHDPKDHAVNITLNVSANDYSTLKGSLSPDMLDKIELRRELAVMHEVANAEGGNIYQRIDNTIDKWSKESNKKLIKLERYKLKYR